MNFYTKSYLQTAFDSCKNEGKSEEATKQEIAHLICKSVCNDDSTHCIEGYTWVLYEETPDYRVDICEMRGHCRIILKKPIKKQIKQKVELAKTADGQLVKGSKKSAEDNILE